MADKNEKVADPHGYIAGIRTAARIVGLTLLIAILAAVITALT